MSRVVYIGGFGNGRASAERVARSLELRYEDVDPFTFAYAMDSPAAIRQAVKGVDTITHSAGMMALIGTSPDCIGSIGAPLPSSPARLVAKTVHKTLRMHTPGIGVRSLSDARGVAAYDTSSVVELARNTRGNLGLIGQIAAFNAVDTAIAAENAGIPVLLGYNHDDEYFRLGLHDELRAIESGVDVTYMPGAHDELVIRPNETLVNFLEVQFVGQVAVNT